MNIFQNKSSIPKGPSLFFFIKNSKYLANPDTILDVFRKIAEDYYGVASFKSGLFERTYIVSDPQILEKIFLTTANFFKYPRPASDLKKLQALIGKGMLATHMDADWQAHRQSLGRRFNQTFVFDNYHPIIEKNLKRIIDEIAESNGPVNISEKMMLFSGRVITTLISPHHTLNDADLLEIKKLVDKGSMDFHKRNYVKTILNYRKILLDKIENLLDNFIIHKNTDQSSLLAVMYKMFENNFDQTAKNKILDQCLNLVVAGFETTSTTLSWIFYLLARSKLVQDRLYQELKDFAAPAKSIESMEDLKLLNNVIKEGMRLYPALWFNIRYVKKECVFNGVKFVKNARIMLLPFIANRDPIVFKQADDFNPDRFDTERDPFFAFGHGQRVCIGKALAELELRTVVIGLVKAFCFEPGLDVKSVGGVPLQAQVDIMLNVKKRSYFGGSL